MVSSYKAGYYIGRLFTRTVKVYLAGKLVKKAFYRVDKISECHKINSADPEAVTNNVFNCLEYLE